MPEHVSRTWTSTHTHTHTRAHSTMKRSKWYCLHSTSNFFSFLFFKIYHLHLYPLSADNHISYITEKTKANSAEILENSIIFLSICHNLPSLFTIGEFPTILYLWKRPHSLYRQLIFSSPLGHSRPLHKYLVPSYQKKKERVLLTPLPRVSAELMKIIVSICVFISCNPVLC